MKIKKIIEEIEGVELVEKADKGVFLVYLKQKLSNKGLLEIAKHNYPVGTKFIDMEDGTIRTVASDNHYVSDHEVNCGDTPEREWQDNDMCSNPFLFLDGKWAEIAQPLFKTEDGVDVYYGDNYWVVVREGDKWHLRTCTAAGAHVPANHFFSSKALAQAYIDAHKPLELVEGEIYTSKEDDDTWIFRFQHKTADCGDGALRGIAFSMISYKNNFEKNTSLCYQDSERACRPSSLEEKKQLITAEVNNGYFHGL